MHISVRLECLQKYLHRKQRAPSQRLFSSEPPQERTTDASLAQFSRWNHPEVVREYFLDLANTLKYDVAGPNGLEEFYRLSAEQIKSNRGSFMLLRRFGGSVVKALRFGFPEHNWLDWKFGRVPKSFWHSAVNKRNYLDWLGRTALGVQDPTNADQLERWYDANWRIFRDNHGAGLVRLQYNDNFIAMLQDVYNTHAWVAWRFNKAPDSFWAKVENQRAFFDHLGSKYLQIEDQSEKTLSKWYHADWVLMRKQEGSLRSILGRYYSSSPSCALRAIYPEHIWQTHLFDKEPQNSSAKAAASVDAKDATKQLRSAFETAAKELKITNYDQWYTVSKASLRLLEIGRLLAHSRDNELSLASALNVAFQGEHEWLPWMFPVISSNYWTEKEHRMKYFRWLEAKLGIAKPEDWLAVSPMTVASPENRGDGFLRYYNRSLIHALEEMYPNHAWLPWQFGSISPNFWRDFAHKKLYLAWASEKLGIDSLEKWYSVTQADFERIGGGGAGSGGLSLLQANYDGSLAEFVMEMHPEHKWLPWKFTKAPRDFWNKLENQRWFFDWAAKEELHLESASDWYNVTTRQVSKLGAGGLLTNNYNGSLLNALKAIYSDHEWLPWRFKATPNKWWASVENQRQFLLWAQQQLGVQTMEDWYEKASFESLTALGADRLLGHYGNSPANALQAVFAEHNWEPYRWRHTKFHTMEALKT